MALVNTHKYMVCTITGRQKIDLKYCCCTIMKGNENRNKKQNEHENKLKINKAEHLGKHVKMKGKKLGI